MSRLNLTSWQRRRLRRQLAETRDARLYRRTLAVLEFDHGRSAADIARTLGVTRQSVYDWVEAYTQDHDPASLEDEGGRGRHPLLGEDQEHLLEALLAVSPQDLGYPHVSWTVPLLQEVLEVATEQWVSDDTLRRALDRLNYVWKRPRYDLDPDPEREKKTPHPQANSGSAAAQRRVGPRRDRPVADPAVARDLVEARRRRQGLAERPQCPPCDLRGDELADGDTAVCAAREGRSGDFQAFLGEVRSHYWGWHVAMLLDEDPSHTAKASLREAEGMTLLWLPKRSPKLNPMDTLWGQGKDVVSANKQYTTIEEHVDRFLDHLRSLTNQEALHTSGVLSKRFWLRGALSN